MLFVSSFFNLFQPLVILDKHNEALENRNGGEHRLQECGRRADASGISARLCQTETKLEGWEHLGAMQYDRKA